jgi:hypothetical protein
MSPVTRAMSGSPPQMAAPPAISPLVQLSSVDMDLETALAKLKQSEAEFGLMFQSALSVREKWREDAAQTDVLIADKKYRLNQPLPSANEILVQTLPTNPVTGEIISTRAIVEAGTDAAPSPLKESRSLPSSLRRPSEFPSISAKPAEEEKSYGPSLLERAEARLAGMIDEAVNSTRAIMILPPSNLHSSPSMRGVFKPAFLSSGGRSLGDAFARSSPIETRSSFANASKPILSSPSHPLADLGSFSSSPSEEVAEMFRRSRSGRGAVKEGGVDLNAVGRESAARLSEAMRQVEAMPSFPAYVAHSASSSDLLTSSAPRSSPPAPVTLSQAVNQVLPSISVMSHPPQIHTMGTREQAESDGSSTSAQQQSYYQNQAPQQQPSSQQQASAPTHQLDELERRYEQLRTEQMAQQDRIAEAEEARKSEQARAVVERRRRMQELEEQRKEQEEEEARQAAAEAEKNERARKKAEAADRTLQQLAAAAAYAKHTRAPNQPLALPTGHHQRGSSISSQKSVHFAQPSETQCAIAAPEDEDEPSAAPSRSPEIAETLGRLHDQARSASLNRISQFVFGQLELIERRIAVKEIEDEEVLQEMQQLSELLSAPSSRGASQNSSPKQRTRVASSVSSAGATAASSVAPSLSAPSRGSSTLPSSLRSSPMSSRAASTVGDDEEYRYRIEQFQERRGGKLRSVAESQSSRGISDIAGSRVSVSASQPASQPASRLSSRAGSIFGESEMVQVPRGAGSLAMDAEEAAVGANEQQQHKDELQHDPSHFQQQAVIPVTDVALVPASKSASRKSSPSGFALSTREVRAIVKSEVLGSPAQLCATYAYLPPPRVPVTLTRTQLLQQELLKKRGKRSALGGDDRFKHILPTAHVVRRNIREMLKEEMRKRAATWTEEENKKEEESKQHDDDGTRDRHSSSPRRAHDLDSMLASSRLHAPTFSPPRSFTAATGRHHDAAEFYDSRSNKPKSSPNRSVIPTENQVWRERDEARSARKGRLEQSSHAGPVSEYALGSTSPLLTAFTSDAEIEQHLKDLFSSKLELKPIERKSNAVASQQPQQQSQSSHAASNSQSLRDTYSSAFHQSSRPPPQPQSSVSPMDSTSSFVSSGSSHRSVVDSYLDDSAISSSVYDQTETIRKLTASALVFPPVNLNSSTRSHIELRPVGVILSPTSKREVQEE